jgi:hypothetical protein
MVGRLRAFCKAVGPDKNKKIALIGWTDFKKKFQPEITTSFFFPKT